MRAELVVLACFLLASWSSAQESTPTTLGAPAALEPVSSLELIRIAAGTSLYGQPNPYSKHIATVDVEAELPILATHNGWAEVRYADWRGWIQLEADEPIERVLSRSDPSPRLLSTAAALMDLSEMPQKLGPLDLLTDVDDQELLTFLARVTTGFGAGYQQRLGLEVGSTGRERVILFAQEADYRQFEASQISAIDTTHFVTRGHSTDGLAVLFVGTHDPREVAAVLVHELTHLMNRRAFSAALPPWLEEGFANEMAFSKIRRSGTLSIGSLGGRSVAVEEPVYRSGGWIGVDRTIELSGAPASLRLLAQRSRLGLRIPLTRLTAMDWDELAEPHLRSSLYATSAFFVRFLLDSDPELARAFRLFLAELVGGQIYLAGRLAADLGTDWESLERAFDAWLETYSEGVS